MLPSHQQFAFKAEDLVLNYLISKGCEGYKAETKELQFEDKDLICKDKNGNEFTVSVKFMPMVLKTGNYAFETKLVSSQTGATMDGWFTSGQSDYTCICIPKGDDQMEITLWETNKLKEIVPTVYHRKASLGNYQRSFNAGRRMDNVEILLVKKEKLINYGKTEFVKI